MATVGVNTFSMVALIVLLHQRLQGLPWHTMGLPILGLAVGSIFTGFAAWGVLRGCQFLWGSEGLVLQLVELSLAGLVGLLIFGGCVALLKLPEVDFFLDRIQQKLPFLGKFRVKSED